MMYCMSYILFSVTFFLSMFEVFDQLFDDVWMFHLLTFIISYMVSVYLWSNPPSFVSDISWFTLQGTNISHQQSLLKMIFLFPRWDMLIPWRVYNKNPSWNTKKKILANKGWSLPEGKQQGFASGLHRWMVVWAVWGWARLGYFIRLMEEILHQLIW